ncbi:glutathione S-transferase family protein [Myxococcota bacterium]|nr:glutathione S-transferase family protein [Myxococcota bacterium]
MTNLAIVPMLLPNPQAPTRRALGAPPRLVLCELGRTPVPGLESYSPFCLKTHRALVAAGLEYTSAHAPQPAAHKALNPQRQVPVLVVDGRPVADSTEILRELLRLRPGALAAEPEDWLFEELADTALNGFVVAARWADPRNWDVVKQAYFGAAPAPIRAIVPAILRRGVLRSLHARDVTRAGLERCWARFSHLLDQLDARAPEQGFWSGPRLSVADVALFGQLHSLRTDLTTWQAEQVAARVRLTRWLDRVDAATRRPA